MAEVEAATAYVVAALEMVDSRIAGWDIGIVDTVADNASAGLFVLGETPRTLGEVHLPSCLMTLRRNGDIVARGTGAQCFGDPRAVAWLATTVRERGEPLRAGDVVLSGPVAPGDVFTALISGVGEVDVSFAGISGRAGRAAP